MANEVTIHVKGKDDASKVIAGVDTKVSGFKKALGGLAIIPGPLAAVAGVGALGLVLADATRAAIEDAEEVSKLKQTYQTATGSLAGFDDWMNKAVKSGERLAFTDSQVRDALNLLTIQGHDAEEATRRLAIAQDLSRATGMDMQTAAKLVGKVSAENTEVLKRYGITLGENATEEEALAAIQAKVSGAAQAHADTTAGKMERLQIRMDELKEVLGAKLLPILEKFATFLLEKVIPYLEKLNREEGPGVVKAINDIAAVIHALMPVFEVVFENIRIRLAGFIQSVHGMFQVIAGVVALVDDLIHGRWAQAWTDLKLIAEGVMNLLLGGLRAQFGQLADMIIEPIRSAIRWVNRLIERLSDIHMPNLSPGFNFPDIKPFQRGTNFVPQDTLALLHKGEAVIPAGMNRGGGGPNITLHVAGSILSEKDIVRVVRDAIRGGGFRDLAW